MKVRRCERALFTLEPRGNVVPRECCTRSGELRCVPWHGQAPMRTSAQAGCMHTLGSEFKANICAGRAYVFTPLLGASLSEVVLSAHRTGSFEPRSRLAVPPP
eukprot:14969007-Alexandrium_andersonii.AAC.1